MIYPTNAFRSIRHCFCIVSLVLFVAWCANLIGIYRTYKSSSEI